MHRARWRCVRRSSLSGTPSAASCSQQREALARAARPRARRAGPRPRSRSARRSSAQRTHAYAQAGVRRRAQNHRSMIVLGIDPGLANTGYGVVARRGGRLVALDGGVIETRAGLPAERRLADDPRRGRRAARRARARRGGARGAVLRPERAHARSPSARRAASVMLAAGQRGLPCTGYTPQQVKGAVCGNGRAGKDQVARMVAGAARAARAGRARPRRRRARGGDLPRSTARRSSRALAGARRDDRAAARRGRGAPRRPRRGPLRRRRLPRGRLGRDAAPRAAGRASR